MNPVKISLIGEPRSGKTTFCKVFARRLFDEDYTPTLGVEVREIALQDNVPGCENIHVSVWDIVGDEKWSGLVTGYTLGSVASLIFCRGDINRSLQEKWDIIKKYRSEKYQGEGIETFAVVETHNNSVEDEGLKALCNESGMKYYSFELSNVEETLRRGYSLLGEVVSE